MATLNDHEDEKEWSTYVLKLYWDYLSRGSQLKAWGNRLEKFNSIDEWECVAIGGKPASEHHNRIETLYLKPKDHPRWWVAYADAFYQTERKPIEVSHYVKNNLLNAKWASEIGSDSRCWPYSIKKGDTHRDKIRWHRQYYGFGAIHTFLHEPMSRPACADESFWVCTGPLADLRTSEAMPSQEDWSDNAVHRILRLVQEWYKEGCAIGAENTILREWEREKKRMYGKQQKELKDKS